MKYATFVNNAFTAVRHARPVSHLAALGLLGTSLYFVHEGAASILPVGLTVATTCAMVAMEWLQWTGLGRLAKLREASEDARAEVLKLQCWGIAALQVILYTLAVVNFAAEAGANWASGWALMGAVAIAAMYAGLNFVAKWTSCDPVNDVRASSGPTGGSRVHDVLFNGPALPAPAAFQPAETARYTTEEGVVDFEEALRKRGERTLNELDPRLISSATRDAAERFKLWKKREQTRQWRGAKAAAAA